MRVLNVCVAIERPFINTLQVPNNNVGALFLRSVFEIKFSVILAHESVKLLDRPMHNSCAVRYKMQELY